MSLIKTWFTLEEAEAKFGIDKTTILRWVDEGVVRTEQDGAELRVNADDLELKADE